MPDFKIRFTGDNSILKRSINGSKNALKKLGESIKNIGSGAGLIIGGGIAAGLGLMTRAATKTAAAFEQTRVSYEVMLGSVDKAQKVLSQLTQFSTVTPFEPEQVYQAGKQLLAFGVTAEDLIPTLRKIGDLAAGTGKDFNELAGIFGKIKTKGKAQAEELNQMAEAGIPIIQELAKMYNTTAENIYKMGSAGQITFSAIEEAFGRMTGSGGKFKGMMEKQSQTFNGVLSTLKGNISEVGKEMANSWLPVLKKAADFANVIAKGINAGRGKSIEGLSGDYAAGTQDSVVKGFTREILGFGPDEKTGEMLDLGRTIQEKEDLKRRRELVEANKAAGKPFLTPGQKRLQDDALKQQAADMAAQNMMIEAGLQEQKLKDGKNKINYWEKLGDFTNAAGLPGEPLEKIGESGGKYLKNINADALRKIGANLGGGKSPLENIATNQLKAQERIAQATELTANNTAGKKIARFP